MRIGINVPNDLLKRMEPLKQMTNVSQVCRDAIQAWVDMYERARERASQEGMEEIALRLRQELERHKVDWEALGHEDAKLWAQIASLKDFEDLFHNMGITKKQGRAPGLFDAHPLPGTKRFHERLFEHKEWLERQIELDERWNPVQQATKEYTHGWLSYITAVWEMVKQGNGTKDESQATEKKLE